MILKGENLLQSQVCKILGFCGLPYFSIPNGVNKSLYSQLLFSLTGLKAGVPDLFVARAFIGKDANGFEVLKHGLFIENKNGKNGKLTPKQHEWHATLLREGYEVVTIKELHEIYATIIRCYPEESKKINNINKLAIAGVQTSFKGRTGYASYKAYKRGF